MLFIFFLGPTRKSVIVRSTNSKHTKNIYAEIKDSLFFLALRDWIPQINYCVIESDYRVAIWLDTTQKNTNHKIDKNSLIRDSTPSPPCATKKTLFFTELKFKK